MSTLRNAAAILRCISSATPELSVSDMAARIGLPKSTTSRLLTMMCEEGLLEHAGRSRRYRPGPLVVAAGRLFRAGSTLVGAMDGLIADVARASGHTGYVSVRDGRDIFAIKMHQGAHAIRVVTPLGARFQAASTAVGRALLARHSDAEILAIVEPLAPPSAEAPQSIEDLMRRIDHVRVEGIAHADDEANRGVGTIAIAVYDPEGDEEVAGCISFSLATVTSAERALIRERLGEGRRRLAERFGDTTFPAHPSVSAA